MISFSIKRLGMLAAFVSLAAGSLASIDRAQQIKIDRAINSPTLAVKYNGVHAALIELRINGESFGTRTANEAASSGETSFSINVLSLHDGDNDIEIRLYDKSGHLVGSEKTVITTDSDTKGPVYLSTPKVGDNVLGPCEITVGFGRDLKNSYVSFFVDNQFKSMMNFPPYTYVWDTTRESNGWHEVEAWVVDDTSSTYKTRKVRVFVNNPGGHTFRPVTTPAVTKPAARTPVKPVVTKSIKTTKLPALPDPRNVSANSVGAVGLGSQAPIKSIVEASAVASAAKTMAMAPTAIVGLVTDNAVKAQLEGHTVGAKAVQLPNGTSVGPRLMTPTGKRNVETKEAATKQFNAPSGLSANPVNATVSGNAAESKTVAQIPAAQASSLASTATAPKLTAAAPEIDNSKLVALIPAAATEAPAEKLHPLKLDVTGEGVMSKPATTTSEPAAPIVPAETKTAVTSVAVTSMGSTDSYVKPVKLYPNTSKPIKTPARKLINVVYGTRLPITGNYTVLFNGSKVLFDVAPSIHAGVPVTPFRHLIEKAGGQINWLADDKEVVATTDGHDIWLKIGDQMAKIDDEAIKLELAPFIQSGRTIVPLSFIRSALGVNVEYDKATGHVLITKK